MLPFAQARRAFTLIELVVVLAVMGLAIAIVAPSLVLPPRETGVASIIANAKSIALRRAEEISLSVGDDGRWAAYAVRSGSEPVSSGRINAREGIALKLDISPLGLCTVDETSSVPRATLDPFSCTFADSTGRAR